MQKADKSEEIESPFNPQDDTLRHIEADLEELFLNKATELVHQQRWVQYKTAWLAMPTGASRDRELHRTITLFSHDYGRLLKDIAVEYFDEILAIESMSDDSFNRIWDRAFTFAARFTQGDYTYPWRGTFVLLPRPTADKTHLKSFLVQGKTEYVPDPYALKVVFPLVETDWLNEGETEPNPRTHGLFLEGLLSGHWTNAATDIARNRFQLRISLRQASVDVSSTKQIDERAQSQAGSGLKFGTSPIQAWSEIQISFLSELKIQIYINGKPQQPVNYAEFGFSDGRTQNPNRAWLALLSLAKSSGPITQSTLGGDVEWPNFEKRMEEIRRVFRQCFGISEDPLPYVRNIGYQPQFKICCSPSFNS